MIALRTNADVRRLTALLAALAVARDDLLDRIKHAQALQDRGALFPIEQDDLIDGVRSWRSHAACIALDLGGPP